MYEKIKYPDGSSYVKVNRYEKEFTFRINSYEDLWILNQLVDVYNNAGLVPTITIPCLIDAQADRRFNDNESFGLKLVVKFLSGLNADFKVFHPHNADALEFGTDNIKVVDNGKYIERVLNTVHLDKHRYKGVVEDTQFDEKVSDYITLMSPDAGMFKQLMKLCDKIGWKGETYSASKSRKYEDGKSRLMQLIDREDFGGKDILIVDDICVNGGTFIGLAKMLKERNVGKLYLAVSHITIENPNPELLNCFDKIFTTNSKFDNYFPIPVDGGFNSSNKINVIKMF